MQLDQYDVMLRTTGHCSSNVLFIACMPLLIAVHLDLEEDARAFLYDLTCIVSVHSFDHQ